MISGRRTARCGRRLVANNRQNQAPTPFACCVEASGGTPDGEECVLNCLFGNATVTNDADSQPICDMAEAVIELAEGQLIPCGDQLEEGFVGLLPQRSA